MPTVSEAESRRQKVGLTLASAGAGGALSLFIANAMTSNRALETAPLLASILVGCLALFLGTHAKARWPTGRVVVVSIAVVVLIAISFPAMRWIGAARYDGALATVTGCDTGAEAVDSWPLRDSASHQTIGRAQLVTSTRCGTAWVRVDQTSSGVTSRKTMSRSASWLLWPTTTPPATEGSDPSGTYSDQVLNAGCVPAHVELSGSSGRLTSSDRRFCL